MAIPYCDKGSLAILSQHGERVRFLLDSGAFTAWKSGKEITVDQYCRFLDELRFRPFGYFTLDKIGDAFGTRANFTNIVRRGYAPIPIFTRGSDWSELDDWFAQSDIVGVGGGTGTRGFPLYIRDVARRIEGTGRKVHWLGFTDKDFIARWRPFSCDSSTSNNAVKYRNLMVYEGYGTYKLVHIAEFRDDPVNTCARVRRFVEWCGEDLYALRKDEGWKFGGVADRVTLKAWASYSIEAEKLFGTKIFSAIGNSAQLINTLDAWWYCAERLLK